jgi:RNA polymerase sigma factor (sigma-70 family)
MVRTGYGELDLAADMPDERLLLIDEALERLEAAAPGKARIVVLRFFGGLSQQEVAETLGVTERTVERHWAFAKAWLYQAIREQQT